MSFLLAAITNYTCLQKPHFESSRIRLLLQLELFQLRSVHALSENLCFSAPLTSDLYSQHNNSSGRMQVGLILIPLNL